MINIGNCTMLLRSKRFFMALIVPLYLISCGEQKEQVVKSDADKDPVANSQHSGLIFMRLSNGSEIRGLSNGFENSLIGFLDGELPLDSGNWFNFDKLVFNAESSEINMQASDEQLNNLAEILRAYPNVELKIGGFTNKLQTTEENLRLSQQRAQAVVNALVLSGISGSRLVPEGYGPQQPTTSNDPEAGGTSNERTAILVTGK